jgi:hypothetical protein
MEQRLAVVCAISIIITPAVPRDNLAFTQTPTRRFCPTRNRHERLKRRERQERKDSQRKDRPQMKHGSPLESQLSPIRVIRLIRGSQNPCTSCAPHLREGKLFVAKD